MSPPAKRVTIREVADAAGVSPAAVSYALRGIQVSEETQERVRKVASDLGYEANPIARALASGRTGMVGILGPSLEDLWQQRLVAEAGRALLAHDRYALILDAGGDPARQRSLATQLRDQQVDGLILSPVDPSDAFWNELTESLAIVSIGDALPGRGAAGEVLFDNRTGVRSALEHLYALGHRRVAVLRPPGSPTNDRPAEVYVGGLGPIYNNFIEGSEHDVQQSEVISLPIALVLLLLVFGGLVAGLLPVLTGLATVTVAVGLRPHVDLRGPVVGG